MNIGNRPVKLKEDLTYKNIFGREKKVMSKDFYVDLEEINAIVSFRGGNYTIPIENICIPNDIKDKLKEVINSETN